MEHLLFNKISMMCAILSGALGLSVLFGHPMPWYVTLAPVLIYLAVVSIGILFILAAMAFMSWVLGDVELDPEQSENIEDLDNVMRPWEKESHL